MAGRAEGSGWTRAAVFLGVLSVGAFVGAFLDHNYVGGPIFGVILGAAAARCWYLGG